MRIQKDEYLAFSLHAFSLTFTFYASYRLNVYLCELHLRCVLNSKHYNADMVTAHSGAESLRQLERVSNHEDTEVCVCACVYNSGLLFAGCNRQLLAIGSVDNPFIKQNDIR